MEEEQADSVSDTQAPVLEIADQPSREFLELFTKLDAGISGELIEKAWKQYDTTGQQIVLEVCENKSLTKNIAKDGKFQVKGRQKLNNLCKKISFRFWIEWNS